MTQSDTPNNDQRTPLTLPSDAELRERWYQYAAAQPGSIESLLAFLRRRVGQTPEEQQSSFAISAHDFLRLQSLRMPRVDHFAADADRIAVACHVGKPFEFTQALLLAHGLLQSSNAIPTQRGSRSHGESSDEASSDGVYGYEAAYDASDSIDDPEDEE